jgi:hypothetical protein
MSTFTITINPNAQLEYFEYWLRNNYTIFDGVTYVDGNSYIAIITTEVLTTQQRDEITSFYNALTVDDVIENKHCRIYTYLNPMIPIDIPKTMPPCTIDYRIEPMIRLAPLVTSVYKGEVREIIYYASVTQNQDGTLTGETPVVKEEITYTRDVAKMAISRVMKIWWYLNDDTVFSTHKERFKYYAPQEKIAEGQRLRGNIIDFMQPPVLYMLMQTEQIDYDTAVTVGAELYRKYSSNISSWISASRGNDLIDLVAADTEILWLDNVIDGQGTTIRDYILDQLNY